VPEETAFIHLDPDVGMSAGICSLAGNDMLADTELFETAIEYVGAGYVFDQTAIHRHCTLLVITSAKKMFFAGIAGIAGIFSAAPLQMSQPFFSSLTFLTHWLKTYPQIPALPAT
jgi:hypothetical protein